MSDPGGREQAEGAQPSALAEELADHREGVALTGALAIGRDELLQALRMVAQRALAEPAGVLDAQRRLLTDLVDVLSGRSDYHLDPADARFADPAWHEDGVFQRIGQLYMAWGAGMDRWLETAGFEGRNADRARFVLQIAKDLLAPPNVLLTNPAALRKAGESSGASLVNGVRNLLDDARHNHGYPACADRNAYELGVDVCATPGSVVFRTELFELIQYNPITPDVHAVPLVYVFSQVNRFYLGDLTPDRSLFQRLLARGIQVFAVSWRNPTEAHRDWGLDTYAGGVVEALQVACDISHQPQANLIGVCAGGLTTATAAALLAARGDQRIASSSLFINVLDNRPEDSDFGLFVSEQSVAAQKARTEARGVFAERDVFEMFAWLRPEENVMSFLRSNYLLGEPPPVHPLLFWSIDYTRLPVRFHTDILDLSVHNTLARGELLVDGQRLNLADVQHDVYLMAGSTDHITPWRACYRSTRLFGRAAAPASVEFVLTNQNHTQTISAKPNPHLKYWIADVLPEDADSWVQAAVEHAGDWREHWSNWLVARSGARVSAPAAVGAGDYPALDPAPGRYVRE